MGQRITRRRREKQAVTDGPRERLVASTIELVRERGVDATGVAELLAHSQTARASIYQHFPGGKADLVTASTKQAGDQMRLALRHLAEAGGVAAMIEGIVGYLAAELNGNDFRLGCPIVAAAVARPDTTGVQAAAADVFASWVDEIATALEKEGRNAEDARTLAGFVVDGIEGARVRARCSRSDAPLVNAARQLATLLAAKAP